MLKNAIKIALGVKNCIPKIWRFFWKKLCTFLVAYVRKNVGKNRAKRFLENSSFLVRVAIYFLIPHEEFKTEKIIHPSGLIGYPKTDFWIPKHIHILGTKAMHSSFI